MGGVKVSAPSKRLTVAAKRSRAPMRRLTPAERSELLHRLDPSCDHLPLLHGTGGYLLIGHDGDLRTIELWRGDTFVAGYLYQREHIRDATLVLPPGAVVFVTLREAA